ncbi:AAA family ATPase [Polaromonas sp. YR568]|uniref:AAA family ATPase n=1 Tax=Polaromonas sp. YR568 TaxID=1855301 RepID=UPI00398BC444
MLHSYSFKNFQSFRERAHISLELNNKMPARGWETVSASGQRLTTALAVLGANGAGKTAALKPLAFAAWFMSNSFSSLPESGIPLTPHFSTNDSPTEIELEAEDSAGILWRYVLHATPTHVVHEALYRKSERFRYVFVRDWDEENKIYQVKQQEFGLAPAEARKVRPNASLISTALQYGTEVAKHIDSVNFTSNVTVMGRSTFETQQLRVASRLFFENSKLRDQMSSLLTRWDLGLKDVYVEELEVQSTASPGGPATPVKIWSAYGKHQTREGATFQLPLEFESSGTQSAFILLGRLLQILEKGGIALIDELENDLHPHMVEPMLDLFANPSTNPFKAQLIFTCHTPEVLDLLQKAQVIFVEKRDCESIAFRGDEIAGLRSDDNLRAKYMAGALGAVPRI